MLAFLYGHPDVAFVYTDNQWIDSAGRPTHAYIVEPPERLLYTNVVGACFLYRRRVYETVGSYAEDIPLAEDYDYWLRVSLRFRMAALHEDLYCYRHHEQTLTHRHSPEAIRAAMWKALARHIRAIPWADAEAKAAVCINEARRARFERHLARMIQYLTLGFLLAPTWAARYVTARVIGRSAL